MLREIGESNLGNMVNAEELVVSFRAENADETKAEMEQVEGQLEETTEQMEEQADEMEGFTSKFRGAMGALVAGIAVAAGGLLTQVPILGETFAGLMAIVDKLALSLDESLRPAFSDLRDELFEISDKIDPDEGFVANLGTLTVEFSKIALGSAEDLLTGEGDIADLSLIIGGSLSASWLLGKLPTVGLGSILTGISVGGLLRLIPVIGIGAFLGGLAGGELGKLLGHEDLGALLGALSGATLAGLLGTIGISGILSALPGTAALSSLLGSVGMGTLVNPLTGSLVLLLGGVISLGDLIDGDISDWNLAAKFGHALGEGFARAWPDMAERIHDAFTQNPVHDAGEWVRGTWEESTGNPAGLSGGTVGAGLDSDTVVNLDGRRLNESTGRYGYDQLTRRGI